MTQYYLAFYHRKNPFYFFARIIEWVDDTKESHVEILRVENGDFENAMTYGSVFPKSRKAFLKDEKKLYNLTKCIPLIVKCENPDAVLESLLGKPYSFAQIFLAGLKILLKGSISCLPYLKLNLSKELICTEFAGLFVQEACQYRFDVSPELLSITEVEQIGLNNLLRDE